MTYVWVLSARVVHATLPTLGQLLGRCEPINIVCIIVCYLLVMEAKNGSLKNDTYGFDWAYGWLFW